MACDLLLHRMIYLKKWCKLHRQHLTYNKRIIWKHWKILHIKF